MALQIYFWDSLNSNNFPKRSIKRKSKRIFAIIKLVYSQNWLCDSGHAINCRAGTYRQDKVKMAKNDKNRRRPGMSDKLYIMRDEMAERQYNMKIAQARKLVNEHNHADALIILEPMKEKFSDRGEYLDLLGASLATTGAIYEAREVLTRALSAPPKSKFRDALNKYNLVRLCTLTGSPFIAYEYSQQLDCDLVAEAARKPSERYQCREMVAAIRQGIVNAAKEAKMPFRRLCGLLITIG